jgi:hypothetical protein
MNDPDQENRWELKGIAPPFYRFGMQVILL